MTGKNPALLAFNFGDLELDTYQSPGIDMVGFEPYTETDGSSVPFTISYNGVMIARGTSGYLCDKVDHINDCTAAGTGRITLNTPGSDPAFYNEVSAITGGTRQLDVALTGFYPVNNAGLVATTGSISATPVPEPENAAGAAAGLVGWAVGRRPQRGETGEGLAGGPAQSARRQVQTSLRRVSGLILNRSPGGRPSTQKISSVAVVAIRSFRRRLAGTLRFTSRP
jgi:hypothetical protein